MRTWKAVVLIVVCMTAGIVLLFRESRKNDERKPALKQEYFYCGSCESEFLSKGGVPSAKCPECEKNTTIIRVRKRCEGCGHEFVQFECDMATNLVRLPGGYWGAGAEANRPCPECGGSRLRSLPE
jgi:rubrerythrin